MRGVARNGLGDKQGAISDYNRAIQLDPNDAFTYLSRGITRDELGEEENAIADF
ncbi:MAG TPA: hypothetical protein DDW51_06770, partial [Cyanobacteria bacterium UBA11367]|nr:hypothetical protein [Cyanobacteria bacterium UBA11367]